jgi:hypothetical protein
MLQVHGAKSFLASFGTLNLYHDRLKTFIGNYSKQKNTVNLGILINQIIVSKVRGNFGKMLGCATALLHISSCGKLWYQFCHIFTNLNGSIGH